MRLTINISRRVVYVGGHAHDLSRVGCMMMHGWLQDNGRLLWGWADVGEFVYQVEVTP